MSDSTSPQKLNLLHLPTKHCIPLYETEIALFLFFLDAQAQFFCSLLSQVFWIINTVHINQTIIGGSSLRGMPSPPACEMWISKTVRRNRQRLDSSWHVFLQRKLLSQRLASSIPEWVISVLYLPYGCYSRVQLDIPPPKLLHQMLRKLLGAPLWRKQ